MTLFQKITGTLQFLVIMLALMLGGGILSTFVIEGASASFGGNGIALGYAVVFACVCWSVIRKNRSWK